MRWLARALGGAALGLLRVLATLLILLDEAVRPLYRPLLRWISGLQIVRRVEAWIGALPRLAVLLLLAIPFLIAEPLKIISLVLIAQGQVLTGGVALGLAHLASFLIVERIYRAGEAQLLSYGWLAFVIGRLGALRNLVLGWVWRQSLYIAARRFAVETRLRAAMLWRRLRA